MSDLRVVEMLPHSEYTAGCRLCEIEREIHGENIAYRQAVERGENFLRRSEYPESDWRNAYGPVTIYTPSRREYLEGVVSSWQDEGEGMLLEDLLDESTLEWVRKKAADK